MLYKFKSKITGDLIMLEPNGRRVLAIIGKDRPSGSAEPGIILPDQMPAAIAALEAAIAQEEAAQQAARSAASQQHEVQPGLEAVSLRQRVLPLLDMLRRCQQAGTEIVWGV